MGTVCFSIVFSGSAVGRSSGGRQAVSGGDYVERRVSMRLQRVTPLQDPQPRSTLDLTIPRTNPSSVSPQIEK